MKRLLALTLVFGFVLGFIAACQGGTSGTGVPDEYAGLENPFAGDTAAATAGAVIYENRCVRCHGENASGNGSSAGKLNPPPSNLVQSAARNNEDYLFWRITEGGRGNPVSSSMPAFSSTLDIDEIWQVITYIQKIN